MRISYIEDVDKWRSTFTFFIPIKVRFSETDLFGHMNNTASFIYFEQARIEYLKLLGLFNSSGEIEAIPVVSDLQCNYLKQVYFDQTLHVYVKAQHVGNTSADIHYMVLDDKQEIALTGRGRLVYIHVQTGKPVPLEESMKEALLHQ
ncbi:acyl-CoA thioesterase [Cerasibacillus sp. JNUCC 74]